ncbi:MAG: hypothetical protein Q8N99_01655 [Nanoarchaeota archaeon]|nr:hypothetical protein [Nanoarchaeota archaeon]
MAKSVKTTKRPISTLVNIAVWITGVLVSLAVGFGMVDEVLKVNFLPGFLTVWAGWIVVILTILSVILNIIEKM